MGRDHVRSFAQMDAGTPCAQPPMAMRAQICLGDLPRESWTTVQVRLNPAHGARRNGAPFINAQPRFGIYRD
jgi:hypothetical protein